MNAMQLRSTESDILSLVETLDSQNLCVVSVSWIFICLKGLVFAIALLRKTIRPTTICSDEAVMEETFTAPFDLQGMGDRLSNNIANV